MPKNRKNPRDVSKLSGKPLADTLEPSPILSPEWTTSRDLVEHNLPFSPEVIKDLTVFLLENININATHLFRADILYDSWGTLRTPEQKAQSFAQAAQNPHLEEPAAVASPANNDLSESSHADERVDPLPASDVPGFKLTRTVVRNLIPRNPKIDRPLAQTCHFYEATTESTDPSTGSTHRFLIVYIPHLTRKEEVPFYHPLLRALATLYDFTDAPPSPPSPSEDSKGSGTLSLHFLLFPNEPIPTRLERTLHALLSTQIRLARGTRLADKPPGATSGNTNPIKDNVIPQHLVQNTYLRIKLKYAPALCRDWVEDTEPSKHVFEDLAIAAFLIELWRSMYGAVPSDERGSTQSDAGDDGGDSFPGFVDVACGNGLLVYVLLQEGYPGWGFDARQRKTWGIFPEDVRACLREEIYIPRPFADALAPVCHGHPDGVVNGETEGGDKFDVGVPTHTGSFPADTFIISNHADELTVWTPLMAALANPVSPLPFLAIPCCSHALSGARHRYPPPKSGNKNKNTPRSYDRQEGEEKEGGDDDDEQPVSGDLAALRQKKQQATDPSNAGFDSSMYGSLTAKTVAVATEVGYDVERTLLRIPSTRNMGVLGGRVRTTREWWGRRGLNSNNGGGGDAVGHGHGDKGKGEGEGEEADDNAEKVLQNATHLVQKECRTEGGVEAAARIWVDRARGLHRGQGRGKQPRH